MSIAIKDATDIKKMRTAGRLASEVLDYIAPFVTVGVTTKALDSLCHQYMANIQKTIPAPLNYKVAGCPPFPNATCISLNHVVCHGIPDNTPIKEGDILNIDITVIKEGYHGDTSRMFLVGEVSQAARYLCQTAHDCMWAGIHQVKPSARLGDIGYIIQRLAEKRGYTVVREFCGHGIGKKFHEPPQVLHYGYPHTGLVLKPGMIFTIEPMINQGQPHVSILQDGWTVVTKDHSLSAQWEHTVLVTEKGYEVLTQSKFETDPNNQRLASDMPVT